MGKLMLYVLSAMTVFTACGGGGDKKKENSGIVYAEMAKPRVDTSVVRFGTFRREIISNGKVYSPRTAKLSFPVSGEIAKVYVRNGDRVKKGTVLAELDRTKAEMDYQNAEDAYEKARLDFEDKLLTYGYSSDTSEVPADILKMIKLRSGYNDAVRAFRKAGYEYASSVLEAPFDGVVADMSARVGETASDVICTVVDMDRMEVSFNILESELKFVGRGSRVTISPFSDSEKRIEGKVLDINPIVDDKGQIKITASVSFADHGLLSGMNAKVFIETRLDNVLIVPKAAVLIKDGSDMLYVYDESSGRAKSAAVEVLQSNSTHHAIALSGNDSPVKEGVPVITSGNVSVSDNSEVILAEKKEMSEEVNL